MLFGIFWKDNNFGIECELCYMTISDSALGESKLRQGLECRWFICEMISWSGEVGKWDREGGKPNIRVCNRGPCCEKQDLDSTWAPNRCKKADGRPELLSIYPSLPTLSCWELPRGHYFPTLWGHAYIQVQQTADTLEKSQKLKEAWLEVWWTQKHVFAQSCPP